jgi:hypothetical protein
MSTAKRKQQKRALQLDALALGVPLKEHPRFPLKSKIVRRARLENC